MAKVWLLFVYMADPEAANKYGYVESVWQDEQSCKIARTLKLAGPTASVIKTMALKCIEMPVGSHEVK
jgi:hypothetical protein